MSRLTTALKNIIRRKAYIAYELVYMDIDGGVYMTNSQNPIENGGNTFLPMGGFLGFSDVEETAEFQVSKLSITLTGIPQFDDGGESFISQFLNYDYVDRRCKIWRVFVDKSDIIANDAVLLFDGYIDKPSIDDNPTSMTTVGVEVSNHWADFERIAGRHTNDDEQQVYVDSLGLASDRIFQYSHITNTDIRWAPQE